MFFAAILVAYTIGAIPTGYIFGRVMRGIDIRTQGSGNLGATNVFRVLGKGPGFAVLFIDILKGILPVVLVAKVFGLHTPMAKMILSLSAVSGHNWTVFLQFKGGKGVATTLGALIGLMIEIEGLRVVVIFTVLIWIICFLATRWVSLSSITAAICLPIIMAASAQPFQWVIFGVVFCLFVAIRHRANIRRLLDGTEPRVLLFGRKNN